MSFNTGNELGSLDERDLYDNAINLDQAMNSTNPTWRDRFGVEKPTIDAALKSAGFMPAGFDFVTGGTLQPGDRNKAVYNPAPNGDNNWYRWNGVFPKEIAANSQPNPKDENNWVPVIIKTDVVAREALRRTYQEVGLNLVEGSFEQGANITSTTDVVLHEKTGKCYSGPIGSVPKGTNPLSVGFVDKSFYGIRNSAVTVFDSLFAALSSDKLEIGQGVIINGYNYSSDGGASSFKVVEKEEHIGIMNTSGKIKLKRTTGHSFLRDSLTGRTPVIAAHRGFHGITTGEPVGNNVQDVYFVPENTHYSISFAAKQNAWGVEGDTKITSDGLAVVFHDETVDRTTDGSGLVSELTMAQLKTLDAGSYVSQMYSEARVMDYDDYFYHCKKNAIVPFCEWSVAMTDKQADDFISLVEKYYINGEGVCLYSGNTDTLAKIRLRNANISLGIQAQYGSVPTDWALDVIYRLGNGFVNLSGNVLNTNPEIIKKIRERGLMISYAIANTPEKFERAVKLGVDIITTDVLTIGRL